MTQLSIFDYINKQHAHSFYLSGSSERWNNGVLIIAYQFKCISCNIKSINGGYLPRSNDKPSYKTYKEYFANAVRGNNEM